jgi:2-methylisocitrate lyase-like PEP mutase family enzyme
MDRKTQRRRAEEFRDLHSGRRLLLLPNVWDVVSAKLYEVDGFSAVGTTSAGIAATLGYPDGEQMPLAGNLGICKLIAEHVSIPVSADLESGYEASGIDLPEIVRMALASGVVGLNLEDRRTAGCDGLGVERLFSIAAQSERIAAVRESADREGIPLLINARTDVLLVDPVLSAAQLEEVAERGAAYREAGADCIFIPDMETLGEEEIRMLVGGIAGPINLIAGRKTPNVQRLEELGIARLSFGPRPMRAALGYLREMAREWNGPGTYAQMSARFSLSYVEVNEWFAGSRSASRG